MAVFGIRGFKCYFLFSNSKKAHPCAEPRRSLTYCAWKRYWAVGRWKNPQKKPSKQFLMRKFRAYGEKKPLQGSWLNFACVTYATFGDDRLRGLGVARGRISHFPIDLRRHTFNTLALPRECVISICISIMQIQNMPNVTLAWRRLAAHITVSVERIRDVSVSKNVIASTRAWQWCVALSVYEQTMAVLSMELQSSRMPLWTGLFHAGIRKIMTPNFDIYFPETVLLILLIIITIILPQRLVHGKKCKIWNFHYTYVRLFDAFCGCRTESTRQKTDNHAEASLSRSQPTISMLSGSTESAGSQTTHTHTYRRMV